MLTRAACFLAIASLAMAHERPDGYYRYGPGRRPGYGPGGGQRYGPPSGWNNGEGPFGSQSYQSFYEGREKIVIAHGVLAALAFVLFFPIGSILIRLGSFRGLWLVHGLFQLFAYAVYIAAFGIGVWIVNNTPTNLLDHYHPIIGIVVFVLLLFQPVLGFVHHLKFKKTSRRTMWTYGHLWLGRIVITLGIINGGLGMLFATETGMFVPSRGQMIAYGVIAGIMWILWMTAALFGEAKRARKRKAVNAKEEELEKEQYA